MVGFQTPIDTSDQAKAELMEALRDTAAAFGPMQSSRDVEQRLAAIVRSIEEISHFLGEKDSSAWLDIEAMSVHVYSRPNGGVSVQIMIGDVQ